ncbi:PREDICTED: suppressor of fused homolog [Amphimedon queenslandica]|uniref:Suppressor of fused homolog n=1 Tax=Amphimedon queenslandica TaxID=400682 RepID=A0A1X7VXQ0_AMPQE|nr:PREDICTED: suppressor of fused homolog [Amphimedon queenslandica]|eukprot:XP_003382357.1 PREDICTED: suppressor of fused homolog [Amphimedon queenslandica]
MSARRPIGLEGLYDACKEVYPDQPNPLQIASVVKFWLGGPDPLDFINIYINPGDKKKGIPPHWHYVTCGLSDLYGDSRVHEVAGPDQASGFGFELTFRLDCDTSMPSSPSTWPAELLQALSRYVFQSDNVLCVGDHISWHTSLDNSDSRIQHMLLASDPQLKPFSSSLGSVSFIQIVGITSEELQAAQQWSVPGVLDLMRQKPLSGGEWLITNMRRGESLFEMDSDNYALLQKGITEEGSCLSGVSAVCSWEDGAGRKAGGAIVTDLPGMGPSISVVGSVAPHGAEGGTTMELLRTQCLNYVELSFNFEAAKLLFLALNGRVKHGRHFTFKSVTGDVAITLVSSGIEGAFADEEHPLASQGTWLHVFISKSDIDMMLKDIRILNDPSLKLPCTFKWASKKLSISVHGNDQLGRTLPINTPNTPDIT